MQLEACVEPPIASELGGREGEMNISRISEIHLVVIPAIAGMGQDVAATRGRGLQRVSAEQPVAEIDDVNILLDEDISGERAIPQPVAQAVFVRRRAGTHLLQ